MTARHKGHQTTRLSVTFPEEHYRELERLAKKKKVSVAWVIRDSVEAYLRVESPLFPPETMNEEQSDQD